MAQQIFLKSSNVPGNKPTSGQLELREIAINTADGKAFIKDTGNTVSEIIIADTANAANGQMAVIDGDGNFAMNYADRAVIKIKADEAIAIGDPVYITGIQGDGVYNVAKADASDPAKMPAIGIADEAYVLNDQGFAHLIGDLKGYNTTGLALNATLYVAVGGGLTDTKPSGATDLIQGIARVGSVANNGDLVVIGAGRTNDVPNSADFVELSVGGNDVLTEVNQLTLTTTTGFTTSDLTDDGSSQNSKVVLIENGANDITVTINTADGFNAIYLKGGDGEITFVSDAGRTLKDLTGVLPVNGTLRGVKGSRVILNSFGSTDYLSIDNLLEPVIYVPMILEFTTTQANQEVFLPYTSGQEYSGVVDWGDGNGYVEHSFAQSSNVYATAGTYTVTIVGAIGRFSFGSGNNTSRLLLTDVKQFGTSILTNNSFTNCSNLTVLSATDAPDLSSLTSLSLMFNGCTNLTSITNINTWVTSTITDTTGMFNNCTNFNQALSFDTSNVTAMLGMFQSCTALNQPITFDTSSVTTMEAMFRLCTAFNQAITFDTSNVNDMNRMFQDCSSLNSSITLNNSLNVASMQSMFENATAFNQPITFVTSGVASMQSMFENATAFNQPLTFDTSSVTNMSGMFRNALAFNQDISNLDYGSVNVLANFMFGKSTANYSTANYDALLTKWSLADTAGGLEVSTFPVFGQYTIGMGTIQYSTLNGAAPRLIITGTKNWTISDGGAV